MKKYFLSILVLLLLSCNSKQSKEIGLEIGGNFDNEGKAIVAKVIQTKFGNGNIKDGKSNDYVVSFNDTTIKPLKISCSCSNLILINEGDLNNDGIDEISIASVSNINSIIDLQTYSVSEKRFRTLLMSVVGVKKEVEQSKLQDFIAKSGDNIIQYSYFEGIIVNSKNGMTQNKISKKVTKIEYLD
ncbi:MAG TPA: hypothetical protein VJL37_00475 [Flavobacterium sp.]|nr:hypothetical protein [Flavobacterium sp.]